MQHWELASADIGGPQCWDFPQPWGPVRAERLLIRAVTQPWPMRGQRGHIAQVCPLYNNTWAPSATSDTPRKQWGGCFPTFNHEETEVFCVFHIYGDMKTWSTIHLPRATQASAWWLWASFGVRHLGFHPWSSSKETEKQSCPLTSLGMLRMPVPKGCCMGFNNDSQPSTMSLTYTPVRALNCQTQVLRANN